MFFIAHRYFGRLFDAEQERVNKTLARLLARFAKEGTTQEQLAGFSVSYRFGRPRGYDKDCHQPYWDTWFGIRLWHNDVYVACIGFDPEWRSLMVGQIQGKYGKQESLALIKWEKLLVVLLSELARPSWWFRTTGIITASSLFYYRYEERRAAFNRRYDGTARVLGYQWDARRNAWLQSLRA